MKIDQYDIVLLKDGKEGTIIEKFDETHFMIDSAQSSDEWGISDITIEDIEKIISKSNS